METDDIYKELEPDANEIVFGQRTPPDRPLTTKEASKKKKVLLQLVDQKLKFKLVELMKQQVASQHNSGHNQEISASTAIPATSQTTNDSRCFGEYQPQSNWSNWPGSGLQHGGGYWHAAESQSYPYPTNYGPTADTTWNSRNSFQPNLHDNSQYAHQQLSKKALKRKLRQNPNLIHPSISYMSGQSNNQVPTSTEVRQEPSTKRPAPASSIIPINHKPTSPSTSTVVHPPMKNQLPAATPPVSTVPKPTPMIHQIPQLISSSSATDTSTNDRLTLPRKKSRGRRFGRKRRKEEERVQASAQEGINVPSADDIWNKISRLVDSIFRKGSNQIEPLSPHEQKLQKKILIEMSANPEVLRSNKNVSLFLDLHKIEEIIAEGKIFLQQIERSNPRVQKDFVRIREKLIGELAALDKQAHDANEAENVQTIRTKINEVIGPFVSADVDEVTRNKLVSELLTNPRTLESSKAITEPIPDKMAAMREIKRILDEYMPARPGKRFFIPINRTIDVPFVTAVRDKQNKLTEENLKELLDALIAKTRTVVSLVKPKIIDPKFVDNTLVMVCANRKTFDLIKTTISGDFEWMGVDLAAVEIKNPLAKSELKTVRMKFTEPQLYHFNDLMVQLKIDNPSLLARRWELREPPAGKLIDSTEEIYVGVDIESLGPIEQMDRVGVLLKSTVTFEIQYDESERNFSPDHWLLPK